MRSRSGIAIWHRNKRCNDILVSQQYFAHANGLGARKLTATLLLWLLLLLLVLLLLLLRLLLLLLLLLPLLYCYCCSAAAEEEDPSEGKSGRKGKRES